MSILVTSGGGVVTLAGGVPRLNADPIPANRRTDWTYAGVPGGIPARAVTPYATFSPGATAAQINAAIIACSAAGGGVVYLNAGIYTIDPIVISSNNVTVRGAGAGQTILVGGALVYLGGGGVTADGRALTGGGVQGTHTFAVASTSGLSVGQMIELDRDDDLTYVINPNGYTRTLRQVNLITDITGTTVTVQNPLFVDFTTGNPQIRFTYTHKQWSGLEDVTLDHTGYESGANFKMEYAYACWAKGVESKLSSSFHLQMLGTLNNEVRDSYIHEAQSYGPNHAGIAVFGSQAWGSNSSGKIENNIFDRLFPAVEMQICSSGFVISYNYFHGSQSAASAAPVTWTMLDNHGPHDTMNLWEGNIGEMFGSDGYFGGSSYGTAARNYLSGYNPNFETFAAPVYLARLSYRYNLVGNVLGSTELGATAYVHTQDGCDGTWVCRGIYMLGYPNMGNLSLTYSGSYAVDGMTYPDAAVASTLLRWGNYDTYTETVRWEASEIPVDVSVPPLHVVPTSYVYTSKPAWFGEVVWPPIGPDVTGGTGGNGTTDTHVHKIPAQLRFEAL